MNVTDIDAIFAKDDHVAARFTLQGTHTAGTYNGERPQLRQRAASLRGARLAAGPRRLPADQQHREPLPSAARRAINACTAQASRPPTRAPRSAASPSTSWTRPARLRRSGTSECVCVAGHPDAGAWLHAGLRQRHCSPLVRGAAWRSPLLPLARSPRASSPGASPSPLLPAARRWDMMSTWRQLGWESTLCA